MILNSLEIFTKNKNERIDTNSQTDTINKDNCQSLLTEEALGEARDSLPLTSPWSSTVDLRR